MRRIVFEEDGECEARYPNTYLSQPMTDVCLERFRLSMYEENYARSERSLALFYCDILQKMVKYT